MTTWWQSPTGQGRPLRIFHPNPAEAEVADMDVPRFIEDCREANAEAVVVSAGGIYAFYPSEVPYHYISPVIGDRDLIGEIAETARAAGVRVIARIDVSKARENVYADHPEWFVRHHDGTVGRARGYYVTCPSAGYQNEGFAHPIIAEILTRYDVDGFHLNAGGFHGLCTCDACTAAFGAPIPAGPEDDPEAWLRYVQWRREALTQQLTGLYGVMQAIKPGVFFMGEMAGQEYAAWEQHNGTHYPALRDAYSELLVSSGGIRHARASRWWVGMSADRVRGSGNDGLINIKIQMRDLNINQTMMPPAEFAFLGYQAIAHGAGLKLPTFGIPATLADPRAMPAIRDLLGTMARQQTVLDTMTMLSHVGLVWPDQALMRADDPQRVDGEGMRSEFAGLYTAMTAHHVQFRAIYDTQLAGEETLQGLDTLVIPTPAYLTETQAKAVIAMAARGGRVVLIMSPAVAEQDTTPALLQTLGLDDRREAPQAAYALPGDAAPPVLSTRGPLPLLHPYRRFTAPEDAVVWLWAAECGEMGIPEDADLVRPSSDPVLMRLTVGQGDVLVMTTSLGQAVMALGHNDHADLAATLLFHAHPAGPYGRPLVTDAPSCVNVTVARWQEGLVIHMVNGAGPAPLDAVAPVGPITVEVKWTGPARCTWVAPGEQAQPLDAHPDGNRLKVVIPRLNAYGQLIIGAG